MGSQMLAGNNEASKWIGFFDKNILGFESPFRERILGTPTLAPTEMRLLDDSICAAENCTKTKANKTNKGFFIMLRFR